MAETLQVLSLHQNEQQEDRVVFLFKWTNYVHTYQTFHFFLMNTHQPFTKSDKFNLQHFNFINRIKGTEIPICRVTCPPNTFKNIRKRQAINRKLFWTQNSKYIADLMMIVVTVMSPYLSEEKWICILTKYSDYFLNVFA